MEQKLSSMISEAEDLLSRARALKAIPGASKLERKINSELKCLLNFRKGKTKDALENHLKSTNLTNLRAILQAVENSPNVCSVLTVFYFEKPHYPPDQLIADVVVMEGYKWIKVIARKPLAVHKIWSGQGQYGDKDISTMAEDYLCAADQNPINYEAPQVCFLFPRGLTTSVHNSIKAAGIQPIGKVLQDPDFENVDGNDHLEAEADFDLMAKLLANLNVSCTKVNLDITTLIVLTSAITNGHCNYIFQEDILTKQAEEERDSPVLPELLSYLEGKELICCKTAYKNFQEILNTVGGDGEKERATELFKKVAIVEDEPAEYAMDLEESSSIKMRSKVIFGTGETLQAITTTANTAFVRAATNQGVKFSAYYHASRALTEQKQSRAIPVNESSSRSSSN